MISWVRLEPPDDFRAAATDCRPAGRLAVAFVGAAFVAAAFVGAAFAGVFPADGLVDEG
jgi:hypothetical protein